jgi:hypothetical protein
MKLTLTSNKMLEIPIQLRYDEYLNKTGLQDSREAWINWKTDVCGMTRKQAVKAAYDPAWGYEKI